MKTSLRLLLVASMLISGLILAPTAAIADVPLCFGQTPTIIGTPGDDDLTPMATNGPDVVAGLEGDDTLVGFDGDDLLCGNEGFDLIFPGADNDQIDGGLDGNAVYFPFAPEPMFIDLFSGIATGEGNDQIVNVDNLFAGPFSDDIFGNGASNLIFGNNGNDHIQGFDNADWLVGDGGTEPGNDLLEGGPGFDWVSYSGSANPVVVDLDRKTAEGEGSDVLKTIEGIIGSDGNDMLIGGPGSNAFVGGMGDDTVKGLGGIDIQMYLFSPGPVTVNTTDPRNTQTDGQAGTGPASLTGSGCGGEGCDSLGSMEMVVGSEFDDTLVGDKKPNGFLGLGGNDSIYGNGKGDWLIGDEGDDYIDGGGSADVCEGETLVRCEGNAGSSLDEPMDVAFLAFRKH